MKGGVILIGSLRWETDEVCVEKKMGRKRKEWRDQYLDVKQEKQIKLPIRYGRSSSSRFCTYTMVFSKLSLNTESYGLIVPYNSTIDFNDYINFEKQAQILSDAEGISKDGDNKLCKDWGCIVLYINPDSKYSDIVKSYWETLKLTDKGYKKRQSSFYRMEDDEDDSLLTLDYTLAGNVLNESDFDFLFFTYVYPEHRNKLIRHYPTTQEIADEILRSGYMTYFKKNGEYKIKTQEDNEILRILRQTT